MSCFNDGSSNSAYLNHLIGDIIGPHGHHLHALASRDRADIQSPTLAKKYAVHSFHNRTESFNTIRELVSEKQSYHPDRSQVWSDPGSFTSESFTRHGRGQDDREREIRALQNSEKLASSAESSSPSNSPKPAQESEQSQYSGPYPGPLALSLLILGLCLSVYLISLDRTIITTAIPKITNEFHSYDDVGWYGSSYLLTACAFQPLYGRIFMHFNIKWSYLVALVIFEIGSLVCAVAPNSVSLIIGRAIAGLGSAGILTGSFIVVAHAVPLQKRPIYTAAVGLLFGVGAITGPLLGGVFTDLVTWRWCFYFNLPVGAATFVTMSTFFNPRRGASHKPPLRKRVRELDLVGNIIVLGASTMLFLAFSYTEQGRSWSSSSVVGLLIGSGLMFVIFVFWLRHQGDRALLPFSVIFQRSVSASCLIAFFIYGTMLIHAYYLPIWFQAIKGDSAVHSGVSMIPYMIANALFSLLAGIFVSKNGYFVPPAIIGCAIGTVGCGLLSTLNVDTFSDKWIGYQILTSTGLGMAIQQGFTAVSAILPLDQIPIGTAAVIACQSLGGAVFLSVGNTILQHELLEAGGNTDLGGISIQRVIDAGATEFRAFVPSSILPALLKNYNSALQKVFIAAIPLSGLAFIASFGLEWRSVKKKSSNESTSSA